MKNVKLGVYKRVPANMLWDRITLFRKVERAVKLLSHNQKNTHDQLFVQHSPSA